tara:strand:+ start:528 stop:680 length:153 start_codon:yes stop_codon:yes gene_type:complete
LEARGKGDGGTGGGEIDVFSRQRVFHPKETGEGATRGALFSIIVVFFVVG